MKKLWIWLILDSLSDSLLNMQEYKSEIYFYSEKSKTVKCDICDNFDDILMVLALIFY